MIFSATRIFRLKLRCMHSQCVLFESCYTFQLLRAPAVASDRLSIESEGAINEELSAQHMLSCDTDGQDGCTGGKVDRAWYFLRKFG